MRFVRIWEQTASFVLYIINKLAFIIKVKSVYCAVCTESVRNTDTFCAQRVREEGSNQYDQINFRTVLKPVSFLKAKTVCNIQADESVYKTKGNIKMPLCLKLKTVRIYTINSSLHSHLSSSLSLPDFFSSSSPVSSCRFPFTDVFSTSTNQLH
jgi:hypothetical protein